MPRGDPKGSNQSVPETLSGSFKTYDQLSITPKSGDGTTADYNRAMPFGSRPHVPNSFEAVFPGPGCVSEHKFNDRYPLLPLSLIVNNAFHLSKVRPSGSDKPIESHLSTTLVFNR